MNYVSDWIDTLCMDCLLYTSSIDKLDNLAMDVRMDKEKNKDDMKHNDQMEADRKEAAPERLSLIHI